MTYSSSEHIESYEKRIQHKIWNIFKNKSVFSIVIQRINSLEFYWTQIYSSESPLEKSEYVESWAGFCLKLLGLRFLISPYNLHANFLTYLTTIGIAIAYSLTFYTIIYRGVRNEYFKCIETMCIFAVLFPVNNNKLFIPQKSKIKSIKLIFMKFNRVPYVSTIF